jgi:hypothetical protein
MIEISDLGVGSARPIPRRPWKAGAVASTVAGIAILAGCALPGQYDQRGGEAIADAIRAAASDLVIGVDYLEGDALDPASVHVTVRPSTTEAEATGFVCDVVIPAIQSGDPPEDFSVGLWDRTGLIATDQVACPATPTAT